MIITTSLAVQYDSLSFAKKINNHMNNRYSGLGFPDTNIAHAPSPVNLGTCIVQILKVFY
jgi:hypothetical protein